MTNGMSGQIKLALACYGAIWGIGFFSYSLMPMLIGATMEGLGISATQAGLLGTTELLVSAVTVMLVTTRISVIPRRRTALIGAVICFVAHVLSANAGGFNELMVYRGAAGVGAGLALAVGTACVAAVHDPTRIFGMVMFLEGLGVAVLLIVTGYIMTVFSPIVGAYGLQACWVLLMIVPLSMLPEGDETSAADDKLSSNIPMVLGIAVISSMFIWQYCDGSLWSFSERIANSIGVSSEGTGWILAVSLSMGMCAALVASWLGTRYGRVWPLLLGFSVFISASLILTSTNSATVFIAAQIFYQMAYYFTISFLMGLAGEIDHHGRVAAAAGGAANLGGALGPFFTGNLVDLKGFVFVGQLVGSLLFLVLLTMVFVASRLNAKFKLVKLEVA